MRKPEYNTTGEAEHIANQAKCKKIPTGRYCKYCGDEIYLWPEEMESYWEGYCDPWDIKICDECLNLYEERW